MASQDKTSIISRFPLKLVNGLLLLVTSILGVASFFAIMDIILTVGQFILIRTMDSPIQRGYTIITLRNLWMLVGGGLLIAFLIGGIDYHSRRIGKPRTRLILLRIFAIEVTITAISVLI